MSSSISATLRAFTTLCSVQFTIGLRLCPFLRRPVAWGWLCASPPCLVFSGDFTLASGLLCGLSCGSVGADSRAFPARRLSLRRFGVAMSTDEYYRCVLSDSCHLSRLFRAGLGCIGFDYSSIFPCAFGFFKCCVPLRRNSRFARRRPAFFRVWYL